MKKHRCYKVSPKWPSKTTANKQEIVSNISCLFSTCNQAMFTRVTVDISGHSDV